MIITIGGQKVDITNFEEVRNQIYANLGSQIVTEIKNKIKDMKLIDSTEFLQSIDWRIQGDKLTVFSDVKYSDFLEYGTFTFWTRNGLERFPSRPIKKKDLSKRDREALPKGMDAFAPFRRVIFNQNKMGQLLQKSVQ